MTATLLMAAGLSRRPLRVGGDSCDAQTAGAQEATSAAASALLVGSARGRAGVTRSAGADTGIRPKWAAQIRRTSPSAACVHSFVGRDRCPRSLLPAELARSRQAG